MGKHDRRTENGGEQVQAAYDYCEGESAFIIADVTADGAWIAIRRSEAESIDANR